MKDIIGGKVMKNSNIINWLPVAILTVAIGTNYWMDYKMSLLQEETLQREMHLFRVQSISQYSANFDDIRWELDSVDIKLNHLATVSLYLDSCQQARTSRLDRAERRGRFVGGLLKGLFPGL